jgi:hypothetical protein
MVPSGSSSPPSKGSSFSSPEMSEGPSMENRITKLTAKAAAPILLKQLLYPQLDEILIISPHTYIDINSNLNNMS